jgi:hypothetical protein
MGVPKSLAANTVVAAIKSTISVGMIGRRFILLSLPVTVTQCAYVRAAAISCW